MSVELGQLVGMFADRHERSFEVQTYLSGPVVLTDNELCISKLDEDNAR